MDEVLLAKRRRLALPSDADCQRPMAGAASGCMRSPAVGGCLFVCSDCPRASIAVIVALHHETCRAAPVRPTRHVSA